MKLVHHITLAFALSVGASAAPVGDEKPLVLDPVKVTSPSGASDITVDVSEQRGLITQMLVVDVRKGSTAERSGFKVGMEIVAYRGQPVIGISRSDFEALRQKPVDVADISILYEVKNDWGGSRPLAIFVPDNARDTGAPASDVDRLSFWTRGSEEYQTQVEEVRLKRPIALKDRSSGKRLGYEASKALMDWQVMYAESVYDEVRWARPVVKDGKMVAWQLAARKVTDRTAEQLQIDYFELKGKPAAYPGIEADIRSSFESSGKMKPEQIGMFSILYDDEDHALGFWVGKKIGQMIDRTDEFKDRNLTTKESLRDGAIPNSDPLVRRGNRNN